MRRALSAVIIGMIGFAAVACSGSGSAPPSATAAATGAASNPAGKPHNGTQFVVGWTPLSQAQTQGRKAVDAGYKQGIESAGGKELYCAPSKTGANAGDPGLQADCVDQFIAQNVDAIIIWAVDTNAIVSSIKKANDAGIPVFLHYSTVTADSGAKVALSLANPNKPGGNDVAQNLVGFLNAKYGAPKGNILQVQGLLTAGDSITRDRYFNEILAQYPDIKVTKKAADWDTSKGTTIIQDWITANPGTDGIFFESGTEYSPAAAAALDPMGFYKKTPVGDSKHIWMGGIDGESYELHAIACGWQDVSSDEGYQVSVPTMAKGVMQYLQAGKAYVGGDTVEIAPPYKTADVTDEAGVAGPVLSVTPVAVTKVNAKDPGLNGNTQPPPNGLTPCE